jgi:hypothetical protein
VGNDLGVGLLPEGDPAGVIAVGMVRMMARTGPLARLVRASLCAAAAAPNAVSIMTVPALVTTMNVWLCGVRTVVPTPIPPTA